MAQQHGALPLEGEVLPAVEHEAHGLGLRLVVVGDVERVARRVGAVQVVDARFQAQHHALVGPDGGLQQAQHAVDAAGQTVGVGQDAVG